jgi:hypothetical protein
MHHAFSEKQFKLSVRSGMINLGQYRLDTMFYEVIFEFAFPTTTIVDSAGSELTFVISVLSPA